jgi:hypothetical protein
MGSHQLQVRCGDCLAGDHDLDRDSWRTDFMRLVRRYCACADCDCTFAKVLIEEPRFDQRHHQPATGRKRANRHQTDHISRMSSPANRRTPS